MTTLENANGTAKATTNPEADAVFAKVMEDLKQYREAKSLEEACKTYAKKKGSRACF